MPAPGWTGRQAGVYARLDWPAGWIGRQRQLCPRVVRASYNVLSSVRSSVTKLEHDILKTNKHRLMQIGTSDPRSKGKKQSRFGARRSKVKVTRRRI